MKNILRILLTFAIAFGISNPAAAQIKNVTLKTDAYDTISVIGFTNYPPVGYFEKQLKYKDREDAFIEVYRTVFESLLEEVAQATGKRIKFVNEKDDDYHELIRKVRGGKIDMALGIYHETKLYEGLEIIFPSLINNPISIIMLPKNAGKIKNLSQLKKLKGAVSSREYLSDFVSEQMKEYNLEYIDEPEKMFEKLYTGEIDYVFASYFFGIIESSKLGLRDKLSFSKQVIWNMPLFLGISKLSPNRNYLVGKLTSYSEKPESKTKMENKLREMIMEFELKNRGVVPPPYSRESE